MKRALDYHGYRDAREFAVPSGVVRANLCSESWQLATPDCPSARAEYFVDGSQPTEECQLHSAPQSQPTIGEPAGDILPASNH
jgi:membrane carboxypeptidase/penicillin-binding protein